MRRGVPWPTQPSAVNSASLSRFLPDIRFATDRALFGLVLANLFSNAVEYTPVAGTVRVSAEQQAGQFKLSVANTVDNLGPDDLPHLFERFWRKDASRTSSEHAGLGLALAKACADSLGMTLVATMPDPATVIVSLTGRIAVDVSSSERDAVADSSGSARAITRCHP